MRVFEWIKSVRFHDWLGVGETPFFPRPQASTDLLLKYDVYYKHREVE